MKKRNLERNACGKKARKLRKKVQGKITSPDVTKSGGSTGKVSECGIGWTV